MTEEPAGGDHAAALQRRLVGARSRVAALAADLAAVHEASRDSNADDEHDPEGATIAFERQQLRALLDQAHTDVAAAEAALARAGTAAEGRCEVCDRPVGAERLAVRPSASRCVRCASAARGTAHR